MNQFRNLTLLRIRNIRLVNKGHDFLVQKFNDNEDFSF